MTTCTPNECTYPNCPCPHQPLYRMQTNFEKPDIREQIAYVAKLRETLPDGEMLKAIQENLIAMRNLMYEKETHSQS